MAERLTFSVIVPTYQRVGDLRRCLEALEKQERMPDDVVVVCRVSDSETVDFLASTHFDLPLRVCHADVPGQVAALNAGLHTTTADIVAITDDDAAPRRDWLSRIERHYEEHEEVGGVGGRDFVQGSPQAPERSTVGKIQWFGRTIGHHHLGIGPPRHVEFLKGANMTYRRVAIGPVLFDERLRGGGAQVYNDMAFSLAVRRRGWALLYDPQVAVEHYPGVRFDEDKRDMRSMQAIADGAFNETLTLLEHLPPDRRPVFAIWAILAGKRDSPGLLQCLRFAPFEARTWRALLAVVRGRIAAARIARR